MTENESSSRHIHSNAKKSCTIKLHVDHNIKSENKTDVSGLADGIR
jgi:hypothetical protein